MLQPYLEQEKRKLASGCGPGLRRQQQACPTPADCTHGPSARSSGATLKMRMRWPLSVTTLELDVSVTAELKVYD